MGSELLTYPVFAKSMQEADDDLRNFGASWSLLGRYDGLLKYDFADFYR